MKLKYFIIMAMFFAGTNASLAQNQVNSDNASNEVITFDSVVAVVNGQDITEGDLVFASEDLAQELAQVPPEQRRAFLISVLIDMKVMAKAAKEQNMQKTETYVRRLDYLEDKALRRAYFTDVIAKDITPEIVKKAYDDFVVDFKSVQEWRARHILVASLEDAQKVIAEIKAGKDFETAALENSSDSNSAKRGGDLGYFRHKDMTALFEEAVAALKVGQMSEPVKTEFGWHIIKLEDDRMSLPPSFEQVQAQLAQQQLVERFNDDLIKLKKDMAIEIMDKDIEAAILEEQQRNQ